MAGSGALHSLGRYRLRHWGIYRTDNAAMLALRDPSGGPPAEAQLTYARERSGASGATFVLGDTMALPFENKQFIIAVMTQEDLEQLQAQVQSRLSYPLG